MKRLKEKTVDFILSKFSKKNIKYAILRNYEKLPAIGRDLDIIIEKNSPEIQKILLRSAKLFGWTHLILDNSKSKNFLEKNKIEMFYFINTKKMEFLQIDLFRCLSIYGTDYLKIKNKYLKLHKKKYFILNKKISYTYNIFQINSILNNNKIDNKKFLKYRANFLSLKFKNIYKKRSFFEEFLLLKIYKSLQRKNLYNFKKYVKLYKTTILLSFFLKKPFKIYYFFYRIYEYLLLYLFQPSGVKIFTKFNALQKKKIINDFNFLKKKKIILDWDFENNKNFISKVLFLQQRNSLIFRQSGYISRKKIDYKKLFLKTLIEKNLILYGRKSF